MKKVLFSSLLITFLFAFLQGAQAQLINTIAGNGSAGYTGDGGPSVSAEVSGPVGLTIDASGNVYFADANNHCVRKINGATGFISTIAGDGTAGYTGDGGAATAAELNTPVGVALDASGNIYICDQLNERVRMITATTGIITTVAGNGTAGYVTDGVAATATEINRPYCVAFDASGNFYIADRSNDRVRKVTLSTGIITTFAGSGTVGFTGDGGAATAADLNRPEFLLFDASGNLYITDNGNNRIRKVTASTGIINTIAGTGGTTYAGDGSAATATGLNNMVAIQFDGSNNLYVTDGGNNAIRKISPAGIITTVAGTGGAGYNGECLAPTSSLLDIPQGLALSASGVLYIADGGNNRIRKLTQPCSGTPAAGTAVATATTGCPMYGAVVSLNGASSGCYYNYQWQSSSDGSTYTSISGATNTTYVPVLTNSIYFKCIVTCTVSGSTATSSAVFLTVNHPLAISTISSTTNICPGSTSLAVDTATSGAWGATNTLLTIGASSGIINAGTTPGLDTIFYSATNICGTVSDSFVVNINTPTTPAVTVSAFPGTTVCHGSSVVYTATPVNGGSSPTYQWYVNGIFAGIGTSLTYSPSEGDSISCTLTSSVPCPTSATVSNYVIMSIVSLLTPSVVVTDGILGDSVCRSVPVTFNTIIANGGSTPGYQWYLNGTIVTGATSAAYTYTPANADTLRCDLTSSFSCASPTLVTDSILLTVDSTETPAVWISAEPGDTSCYGYYVTYTAYTRYGGLTPAFLWLQNGVHVATGRTYTYIPTTGDSIQCILFSSIACKPTSADSVFSNVIHAVVNPLDTLSVTIHSNIGTTFAIASRDTIVATVLHGGSSPTYQWYKNGFPIAGATTNTYITDTIADADVIYCKVHGSNVCATPIVFASNALTFHINTGIESLTSGISNIVLVPNPNTGSFTLQGVIGGDNANISITNIIGAVIYNSETPIVNNNIRKQILLDAQLPSGIYLIHISNSLSNQVIRFTLDK